MSAFELQRLGLSVSARKISVCHRFIVRSHPQGTYANRVSLIMSPEPVIQCILIPLSLESHVGVVLKITEAIRLDWIHCQAYSCILQKKKKKTKQVSCILNKHSIECYYEVGSWWQKHNIELYAVIGKRWHLSNSKNILNNHKSLFFCASMQSKYTVFYTLILIV